MSIFKESKNFIQLKFIEKNFCKSTLRAFPIDMNKYIYVWDTFYSFSNDGSNPVNFIKYSECDSSFIIFYFEHHAQIFQKYMGIVFTSNYENIPDYISIRQNKIYTLGNNRITGYDLNLYLDDINNFKTTQFKNVEGKIFLYDKRIMELRVYEKNLQRLPFNVKCIQFYYFNDEIFIWNGKTLSVYTMPNIYTKNFDLVTSSIEYCEAEDEFDYSNEDYTDF